MNFYLKEFRRHLNEEGFPSNYVIHLMKHISEFKKIKEIDSLIPMWKVHKIKTSKPYFIFYY